MEEEGNSTESSPSPTQFEISDYNEEFERLLTETISKEEFKKRQGMYVQATIDGTRTQKLQLFYADSLIRSQHESYIGRGITLLEFLVSANPEKRGHYFSYLAFAHARLKDYPTALYYLSFYDADDPIYATNKHEIEWVVEFKKFLQARLKKQETVEVVVAGTSAAVLSIALGFGLVFLKRHQIFPFV